MPGYHSPKQKRQAKHIIVSEKKRGASDEDAKRIGWATVNKQKKKSMRQASLLPSSVRQKYQYSDYGSDDDDSSQQPESSLMKPRAGGTVVGKIKKARRIRKDLYIDSTRSSPPTSSKNADDVSSGVPPTGKPIARKDPSSGTVTGKSFVTVYSLDEMHKAMMPVTASSGASKKPPSYLPGVHNPTSPVRKPIGLVRPKKAKPSMRADDMSSVEKAVLDLSRYDDGKNLKQAARTLGHGWSVGGGGKHLHYVPDRTKPYGYHVTPKDNGQFHVSRYSHGSSGRRVRDLGTHKDLKTAGAAVISHASKTTKSYTHPENTMTTDFDKLFQDEISKSIDQDEKPIIDCPHCGEGITKSQVLAKGKMEPPRSVASKNEDGTQARGKKSKKHNPKTPVRPPGGKRHDEPYPGPQGRAVKKSDDGSSEEEVTKADDGSSEEEVTKGDAKCAKCGEMAKSGSKCAKCGYMMKSDADGTEVQPVQRGPFVGGSEYVQYLNTGEDARIADMISKGLTGQGSLVNMPLDLHSRNR